VAISRPRFGRAQGEARRIPRLGREHARPSAPDHRRAFYARPEGRRDRTSTGKGFQGVMKRHNFGGGRATHGNSAVARASPRSTGQRQDPARGSRARRWPPHGRRARHHAERSRCGCPPTPTARLILIKGAGAGHKGAWILDRDASSRRPLPENAPRPPAARAAAAKNEARQRGARMMDLKITTLAGKDPAR